jgi:hypothetical protein
VQRLAMQISVNNQDAQAHLGGRDARGFLPRAGELAHASLPWLEHELGMHSDTCVVAWYMLRWPVRACRKEVLVLRLRTALFMHSGPGFFPSGRARDSMPWLRRDVRAP